MTEEKYKIKFKDHAGKWRYTKSFTSKLAAEVAQIAVETQMIMIQAIWEAHKPETEIVEVCPSCESPNINTNGGDCYCAECGHKWSY